MDKEEKEVVIKGRKRTQGGGGDEEVGKDHQMLRNG